MVTTRQHNTERAMDIVEDERARLERERSAFRRFARRLERIDPVCRRPAGNVSADGGSVVAGGSRDAGGRSLRAASDAYRQTVMDVDHYDREYGEPLVAHVAAEFGGSVARQIANGSVLTPVLYRALSAGASRALEDRAALSRLLEREAGCLSDCREAMAAIESTVYETADRPGEPGRVDRSATERLATLERECEDVLARRQQSVREQAVPAIEREGEIDLQEYLYADMNVVYPVLADLTDCVEAVRRARDRYRP